MAGPGAAITLLRAPFPGPAGGQGFERVVGPVMLRVAAAHLLADLEVAGLPEPGQVTCDLHRALRRREELEGQGYRAISDPRGRGQAEDFLQSHADAGCV